jgi:hypothetical protein
VVLPEPKKPVKIVAGIKAIEILQKINRQTYKKYAQSVSPTNHPAG